MVNQHRYTHRAVYIDDANHEDRTKRHQLNEGKQNLTINKQAKGVIVMKEKQLALKAAQWRAENKCHNIC